MLLSSEVLVLSSSDVVVLLSSFATMVTFPSSETTTVLLLSSVVPVCVVPFVEFVSLIVVASSLFISVLSSVLITTSLQSLVVFCSQSFNSSTNSVTFKSLSPSAINSKLWSVATGVVKLCSSSICWFWNTFSNKTWSITFLALGASIISWYSSVSKNPLSTSDCKIDNSCGLSLTISFGVKGKVTFLPVLNWPWVSATSIKISNFGS